MDAEHDASLVGRRLGEFVVRAHLGSGGFASVYRAEQPALAREAVIKVMQTRLRGSEELVQRFLREAKLASRLDHPYAAHIYAFGAEPDGLLWIAMELVRGTPLDRLLQARGPIPLEQFEPLLERICQVVQTAHDQGIVHRDLKPANVMVLARAGQLLPKLLDFGIAKVAKVDDDAARGPADRADEASEDGETSGRLTELGSAMGSPLYMAPEQWTDARAVDARTDIYALGVLCHEVLTGAPPFTGKNRLAIARAHAKGERAPIGAAFPPALEAVVARALARKKDDRYASALELSSAFKAASGIAREPVALPRLDDALRAQALVRAPQPLAQAVAALETARNAHQARDAAWQVVRVAARLVGVTALAAHLHIGARESASDSSVSGALRRLRQRAVPDDDWLVLARELTAPFRRLREAYPVPELVDLVDPERAADPFAELAALRDRGGPAGDAAVRELLAQLVPKLEALLRAIDFFGDYRLVVPGPGAAEVWMGVRRSDPSRLALRGPALDAGAPALATADGLPVVSLHPFVQRHAPAPGVADQLFWFEGKGRRGARMIALPEAFELEDEPLWEAVGDLVPEAAAGEGGASSDEESPFPGLAAFTAADAGRFFGRERESEGVVNRLRAQPLVAVVGPSGAGKSSFVQAGVVPSLPAGWRAITLRPGADPMASLAARVATLGDDLDAASLRAELDADPARLGAVLRERAGDGALVVIVDQLEELFTLCDDPPARDRFALALARAAGTVDDPIRVVLTLRDDFLLHAEALPALRARLAPALHLLTTPGRDDLLRMVREPLAQVGYELDDPALADEMVDALATERSALALLGFTASKLWELRDRRFRQISRKAYASLGGVGGALATHAEAALAAMTPEEQRLVREVLRHAVTAEGTRAVLSRAELDQLLGGGPSASSVVEKLIAARLLVSAESATGGEQIELTHEALIGAWPRLVEWRREDAEGARLRDQLRAAARQWDDRKRPSGLLWRGDALAEYRLWRGRHAGALTDVERAFADASVADAERTGRRRRVTIASAFVILTAGMVALLLLNRSANRAASSLRDERRDQAEEQGRSAWVDLHDAPQALAYLQQAADLGEHSAAHDLLVAFASRVPASQLQKLVLPGAVNRASFSPDGTRVVTASDDGTARIWDAASGRELLTMRQTAELQRAEFASDGATILTSDLDGVAILWDAHTGGERVRFAAGPSTSRVPCARLSPDRTLVVTATDHDEASLWDAASGRRIAALRPAGDRDELPLGTPCAFSRDGRLVAIGDGHGVTRVWNAATASLVATLSGQTAEINDVDFSPDGRGLATASSDGTAATWDLASGARTHVLHHRDLVWTARYSADGGRLVTASNDRTAILWDVATGTAKLTLTHDAAVNKAVFQPGGDQIATVSDDGGAYLWDAATGRRESTLQGHERATYDVAYDPAGARLITAGDTAILWSAASQQPAQRLAGHTTTVESLDFSPDGSLLASTDRTGRLSIWTTATGTLARSIAAPPGLRTVRFSPDGRLLATGGGDNAVHLWDVATGREVQVIAGHTDEVRRLEWSADGTRLASASYDATVRIVSVKQPNEVTVLRHDARVNYVALDPASDAVVTVGFDGNVRFWDPHTPAQPRTIEHYVPRGATATALVPLDLVVFDHLGQQLLGSSADYNIAIVWDRDKTPVDGRELRGHRGEIIDSTWSPDGTFVLTGSIDGTARLWDARSGKQVTTFDLGLEQVWSVAYSRDGRHVATGTTDGVVWIWELPRSAR